MSAVSRLSSQLGDIIMTLGVLIALAGVVGFTLAKMVGRTKRQRQAIFGTAAAIGLVAAALYTNAKVRGLAP